MRFWKEFMNSYDDIQVYDLLVRDLSLNLDFQQTMIADDPIPTVQVQDEAGQEIPEENAERAPIPPSAAAHKWDEVRYLIEKGADVNTADSRGVRPLVYALHVKYQKRGRGEDRQASTIVKLLLGHGAKFGMRELNELPRSGSYGEREYKKLVTKENLECDVEDSRFQGLRDI
ncbi:ankyrin repeat protein [Penicillium hetheringtonii]|uniref:Ankyrin repeat protein n=1 Tax=Penicillium hetheringtonii TaxID=911720 RepID=A0AAD6GQG0_9EURO|nr:ankyrin repeat protein [Penicillium hetheringtonii]